MQTVPRSLGGDASMEEVILGIDWSVTPLGEPSGWPLALTSIVSLILASGKPMFIVWGSHRTLLYNEAYIPLLGTKHPLALGMPFFSVWPDAGDDVGALFDRLFGNAAVELDDISISFDRERDASSAHFAVSYTPIRDQMQGVVGVLCIQSDATKSTANVLTTPRDPQRLARIFEQAPNLIAVLSGPEHCFELANSGFVQLVGERALLGLPFAKAVPEAVEQGYASLLEQVLCSGEPVVRSGQRYVRIAPSGHRKVRFIDFVLQPITDLTGHVTGIFFHGSDVSERLEGEIALRERDMQRSAELLAKEALIHTVYEHSSDCHIVVRQTATGTFRVEEINTAALRLCQASREAVIGRSVDDLATALQATALKRHLAASLDADAQYHCEIVHGSSIFEAIASPLPEQSDAGRRIAVSARNITERRNLEEQLRQSQKMEAVGQLTGGLAHDFNNLLTGITGSLDILEKRLAAGQIQDASRHIANAKSAAHRAAALTQRLLAFSRRQAFDAKSIDINLLIADMRDFIGWTMGPTIRVEFRASTALFRAWVDPNQLENALLNLCINARDAMPDGGELVIETRNHSLDEHSAAEVGVSAGEYSSFSVRDTGAGMSPGVLSKVFEPFFTTKPTGEGTGLGLSMVYGFARQSDGQTHIESAIGRGTIVRIYLPRHEGAVGDSLEQIS